MVAILICAVLLIGVVDPVLFYVETVGLSIQSAVELWAYTVSVVVTVLTVKYFMSEEKE
jgi:hypothetical protein